MKSDLTKFISTYRSELMGSSPTQSSFFSIS